MNYYKQIFIAVFLVFLFISCISRGKDKTNDGNSDRSLTDEKGISYSKEKYHNENKPKRLKYFNILDTRNGSVIERYPFPADWQQHRGGEYAYTGPNGIKVYSDKGMNYAYSNDPTTLQQYQAVG